MHFRIDVKVCRLGTVESALTTAQTKESFTIPLICLAFRTMSVRNTLVTAFLLFSPLPLVSATTITDLASSFNLTASESLLFPAVALDSNTTVAWIKRNWQLNGDRVQFGQADL